ncbi:MAG: undecaprenyl-phosphate galactose phosphotransferase WbaP [Candidatus Aminicenantes bacterium]|nr:undecaprenyl-phosphate galactose phosphotransferase WbaP [Candidatus Aminicenantes bacterium]
MNRYKKIICLLSLVLADAAALLVSFLTAYFLRSRLLLPFIPSFREIKPLPLLVQLSNGFLYGSLIIVIVFLYEKLYTKRLSFWEETKGLVKGITVSYILIIILVFVSRQYLVYSRAVIVLAWLVAVFIFPLFRAGVKKILAGLNIWKKKVLILGTNDTARMVAEGIKTNIQMGYVVSGFLQEKPDESEETFTGKPVLGGLDDVESISRRLEIKDVFLVLPDLLQTRLTEVLERCEKFAETIRIVPNVGSLFTIGVEVENIGDVLSLSVARNLVKPWNKILKGVFEYFLVTVMSVLLLPLFLIIALAVVLDSKGPVIYVQRRLGKGRSVFRFYKFRSMYIDSEKRLEKYLSSHPEARREWDEFQKLKNYDPRVTRVGKIIRKFSLDELPQIINIFKSDMSLVGPRPYMPREIEKIGKSYNIISRVKPGLTGLWQVRGRNLLPFRDRLLLDEYYVRNWSLWLDIVILMQTMRVWAKGEGAF